MVNQVGKGSRGYEYTPLMAAARYEHFHVVQYLIEQGEADPNITGGHFGRNVLHYAALNEKDTDLIQFLLKHMSIDSNQYNIYIYIQIIKSSCLNQTIHRYNAITNLSLYM